MFYDIEDVYSEVKGCEQIINKLCSADDVAEPEMFEVLDSTLCHSCKVLKALAEKQHDQNIDVTVQMD